MSTTRWIVTYTKHVKQKRKVYHDGVLEISSGKVTLYDDCKALIDRRFLKKDEIVESGGTLSFETHLVDIGDPDGNNKPSANINSGNRLESQKEKCSDYSQRRILGGNSVGFVKRGLEGSRNAGLSCKYECMTEKCVKPVSSRKDLQKVTNRSSSKVGRVLNSSAATLRDACQILSVLKKPSFEGNLVLEDPYVEQSLTSQSSDRCQIVSRAATIVIDADCEGSSSANDISSSGLLSGAAALDTSRTKSSIKSIGSGHTSLTSIISEVLGDSMLPESIQTDKSADNGFSKKVIHDMNSIVPSEKPLETSNGKQHLAASTSSLLRDNIHADERSSLRGMDTTCISSNSTPGQVFSKVTYSTCTDYTGNFVQLCAKASQAGEKHETVSCTGALTGHATSDTIKVPEIPSSKEFTNATDEPSFDLGF